MTTYLMPRTAAIKAARGYVSHPHRRSRTDYVVYGPYYTDGPDGPSTEMTADSYPKARAMRSRKVATIALHLMGVASMDARAAVHCYDGRDTPTIDALVKAGLAAHAAR